MDGESVMRLYISTDIALTACLCQRLTGRCRDSLELGHRRPGRPEMRGVVEIALP
jgi:hypothetical protein